MELLVEYLRRRDQYPVSLSYSNYILAEVGDILHHHPLLLPAESTSHKNSFFAKLKPFNAVQSPEASSSLNYDIQENMIINPRPGLHYCAKCQSYM